MAFQIKNFPAIVASMINHMRSTQTRITSFRIGDIGRVLVEAPAIEIDELYQQVWNGIKDAIPVATYGSFNFSLLDETATVGLVRVTITSAATDTIIPASTVFTFQTGATSYVSSAPVTITAGNTYADVLASAVQAGSLGNIPANTQFTPSPAIPGFVSAINLTAWTNGTDQETEDQRKIRFNNYIQTLQRGTVAAIEYGAMTAFLTANSVVTERVMTANVVEPYVTDNTQPTGLVNCYVHNGVGNTSAALVAQAQLVINGYVDVNGNKVPGYKAAGVVCPVYAATEVNINATAAISLAAALPSGATSASVVAAALAAHNSYILGLGMGQTFEYSLAIGAILGVPGVASVDYSLSADQNATGSQKFMPGSSTVTVAAS